MNGINVLSVGCRVFQPNSQIPIWKYSFHVNLHTIKSKPGNLTLREVKFDTSRLILSNNPDDRVFSTWKEVPKFLSKKTNGKWNWHNLRHRFASTLSKNKTSIFEIMSLLGHSKIETTQNYLQLLP